jgi:predicted CXXCH cytochrome family protein
MKTRLGRLGAALLCLPLFAVAPAAGPPPVQVVSPPANAVLPSGRCYVISKGGPADLAVDGRPEPWAAFAEPLHVARLRLDPGRHELRVGDRTVAVWVDGEQDPPTGWTGRQHPVVAGVAGCARCHETTDRGGLTAVGAVKSFDVCLECHRAAQVEARHAHPLEPLKHCGSCHSPHGSSVKGLLKAPAKTLCASCHDS